MHVTKIFGPPGTGKTTQLLAAMYKEIEGGTRPERIAYVTFSRAARREALDRAIASGLGLSEAKLPYLRTIHSICYSEVGVQSSAIMSVDDYMDFARYCPVEFSDSFTLSPDVDGLPFGYSSSPGNRILNIRQVSSARQIDIFSPASIAEGWLQRTKPSEVKIVLQRYDQYRLEKGKLDYVDLLHLYRDHGAPIDVDVAFIDEAQDLSALQWNLVNKMFSKAQRLYLAGDDDQSIYQFLGSSPYGFYDAPCDTKATLTRTYRLPQKIWDFASAIINRVKRREPKAVEVRGPGGVVQRWTRSAQEVLDTMREGLTDVMVVGATHYQLNTLAARLRHRGIPFRHKGVGLTETPEAQRFYWYHSARKGRSVPVKEAAALLKILKIEGWKALGERGRQDSDELISPADLEAAGVEFIGGRDAGKYLASTPGKERTFQDLYNLANQFGLEATVAPPQVTLTTYHGAKGREASKVILITDCSPSAMKYAAKHPDYERRLAYVGATRAKDELHICEPQTRFYMRALTGRQ